MSSDLAKDGLRLALPFAPRAVRVGARERTAFLAELRARECQAEYERGRADGERAALEKAAGALNSAAERLDQAREAATPSLASAAVELALEIARAIVGTEVDAARHDIERIVRDTLAASGVGRGACVVHLHPLDATRLAHVPFRTGTILESDPDIRPGDVHITTPHGVLVRDLHEVLRAIGESLRTEIAS